MEYNLKTILENYSDRLSKVFIFEPIFSLKRKTFKDLNEKEIMGSDLGFATLLFLFENMLFRNYEIGIIEISEFYRRLFGKNFHTDNSMRENFARKVIEVFRPGMGKRNSFQYFDWEEGVEKEYSYQILKARASKDGKRQFYTLSEDGIELIFQTREYFGDFRISINQLILRKQLEKGQFSGGMERIREMRLEVDNLQERIRIMTKEITKNIVSEEIRNRFESTVGEINLRLEEEEEEFTELEKFVVETRERLTKEDTDLKILNEIEDIADGLREVHEMHKGLLRSSIDLKLTAIQATEESIYHTGIKSFNFEEEVVGLLFKTPLPARSFRPIINPFFSLGANIEFSPLQVFEKQRIYGGKKGVVSKVFLEWIEDEEKINIKRDEFGKIASYIVGIKERKQIFLRDFRKILEDDNYFLYDGINRSRIFTEFFIFLHQASPLKFENPPLEDDVIYLVWKEFSKNFKEISAVELGGNFEMEGALITDMRIFWK